MGRLPIVVEARAQNYGPSIDGARLVWDDGIVERKEWLPLCNVERKERQPAGPICLQFILFF